MWQQSWSADHWFTSCALLLIIISGDNWVTAVWEISLPTGSVRLTPHSSEPRYSDPDRHRPEKPKHFSDNTLVISQEGRTNFPA